MKKLNNAVSWFEIPVTDLERARAFYEAIFGFEMQVLNLANNLNMALFPTEEGSIGGALCQHKDFYFPGSQGPVVYLNAGPDLEEVLSKVESNGGKVIIPKTQISEVFGYMAFFSDTEGNRVALHSQQ